jgi:Eco29kI restriction endonuclease
MAPGSKEDFMALPPDTGFDPKWDLRSRSFNAFCIQEAELCVNEVLADDTLKLRFWLPDAPSALRAMKLDSSTGVYLVYAYPDAHEYEPYPEWSENAIQTKDGRLTTVRALFEDASWAREQPPGQPLLKYIGSHRDLCLRAHQHYESVRDSGGLNVGRFLIEVVPLAPVLGGLVEDRLIRMFAPPWNGTTSAPSRTRSSGFGYDRKPVGRQDTSISPWDAIYPAGRLRRRCLGPGCRDAGNQGFHPLKDFDVDARVFEMFDSGLSMPTVWAAINRGELVCSHCA